MAFYQWQHEDLLLKLQIQPRAKENSITGIHGDMLKLKIKALPVDNKANQQIINYISKEFKASKTNVRLVSGQHHRDKQILIKQPGHLPEWFKQLMDSA